MDFKRPDNVVIEPGQPGTMHIWMKKGSAFYFHIDGSVEHMRLAHHAADEDTPKVIYFSVERFVDRICIGDACFLCGIGPEERAFNNEHVLPRWLLKRYGLFNRELTLPNGRSLKYGSYTVPCCAQCNHLLGELVEEPIQELVRGGHRTAAAQDDVVLWAVFRWMCLIFLKTHLKDRLVPLHLDRRKGVDTIASEYQWQAMHHAHCLARSFYTGARCEKRIMGSLLVIPVRVDGSEDPFDYVDLTAAQALLLRLGDLGLIAVLNDASGLNGVIQRRTLSRITGPVSSIQLRELLAHYAHANLHLTSRPTFHSQLIEGEYTITVKLPHEIAFRDYDSEQYKELFLQCCGRAVRAHPEADRLMEAVNRGTCSFLFGEDNEFIADSLRPTRPRHARQRRARRNA